MENLLLIDAETNIQYTIRVSENIAEKAKIDSTFAYYLLNKAKKLVKNDNISNNEMEQNNSINFDNINNAHGVTCSTSFLKTGINKDLPDAGNTTSLLKKANNKDSPEASSSTTFSKSVSSEFSQNLRDANLFETDDSVLKLVNKQHIWNRSKDITKWKEADDNASLQIGNINQMLDVPYQQLHEEEADDPILEINNNNDSSDQHLWTKSETLLLLAIYKEEEANFSSGKMSMKQCWNSVSMKMNAYNYKISGPKCASKFQSLKRTYKNISDHNKKSGNSRSTWEYYDNMHEIFQKKPWIKPLAVAGSNQNLLSEEYESDNEKENSELSGKNTKKRKMVDYIEKLIAEKQKNRESAEKRHTEKMAKIEQMKTLIEEVLHKKNN